MARIAAIALLVALALAGCGDHASSSHASPAAATTTDAPFTCPGPHEPARGDGGTDTLPTGATGALLCLHDNNTPWAPPRGVLSTGLDAVVGVVNEQQVHDPSSDDGCGGVGAPAWTMVLQYDDGTRTISGDNGGCWDLLVGSTERFGSKDVFEAYLRAVLQQRHQQGPPQVVRTAPPCPGRSPGDPVPPYPVVSPAAQPNRVVTGTWCRRDGRQWLDAGPATRAQLAVVRHDLATAAQRRHGLRLDHCRGLPRTTHTLLVGRDAWGDPTALDFTCDFYRTFTYPRASFVRMLPATLAEVARVHGAGS